MIDFAHLHCHSEYSLLDGMSTPAEIAAIVSTTGMHAAAITDHGSMSGVLKFQKACRQEGVKPLFGVEAYYVPALVSDDADKKSERFHIILLAKNNTGLHKLFAVMRRAWTTGFYYKPRIEWDDLIDLADDVVCLSGCMASVLCRQLSAGRESDAQATAEKFQTLFGSNYYIELQPWNDPILNNQLIDLADGLGIKLVGTLDCHYPTKLDRGIEEVLLSIAQAPGMNAEQERILKANAIEARGEKDLIKKMNMLMPNRKIRFDDIQPYIMSATEVVTAFADVGIHREDIFSNTVDIAELCSAEIETNRSLLPKFSKMFNSEDYLRDIATFALKEMGLDSEDYKQRLQEELDVIIKLHFADYFLIIWDICKWSDSNNVRRGPARGSVGGSLLAYCLGITYIDPIRHGLLFARFINAERNDLPDIDLDFEDKKRHLVKQYVKEKWDGQYVAGIATYSQFKAKGIVKDVARVFGAPYKDVNSITPLFDSIEELESSKQCRDFLDDHPEIPYIARRIQGRIKGTGAHAAGMVVSRIPLSEVAPIETRKEGNTTDRIEVVALDMDEVADLGLTKFDALGVRAISVIADCLRMIKDTVGIDVDALSQTLDDPAVFRELTLGNAVGVFQVEAGAYRNLITDMGVDDFADLVASNALVRPGALMAQGKDYLKCKQGKAKPLFVHESVSAILAETNGAIIYQEQLMQMAVILGDFTWSEADVLRKIIGKKHDSSEFDPLREKFISNASKRIAPAKAKKLWEDFEKGSLYMFNKAHAVGYSVLSYQCSWLKLYYPTEFILALLGNEDEKERISTVLHEANRLGIALHTPDINLSDEHFSVNSGGGIRFGLRNVSGCGPTAIKEILDKRPFVSFDDFSGRCARKFVRNNLVDNLLKIDAFTSMGHKSAYDAKKYYLPILNYSAYADSDPTYIDILSPCGEIDTDGTDLFIVRGLVKAAIRKPNYFRVEIEDRTGVVAVFADKSATLKSKDYIIALVGQKTLVDYTDAMTATDNYEQSFANFLRMHDSTEVHPSVAALLQHSVGSFNDIKSFGIVLRNRVFNTRKGASMSVVYMYDPCLKKFFSLTIFPKQHGRMQQYLGAYEEVVYKKSETKSGGYSIDAIISVAEFVKMKAIAS